MLGRRIVMFALIAVAALAGAGEAWADAAVLRLATQAAIASFDPDDATDADGVAARDAVYEGLVAYRPGGSAIVGRLAQRWTVSPDGLTYTFTLRPDVQFHDGGAMSSADVQASFDRRRDPRSRLSWLLAGVAATEAPNLATFVVRLSRPLPWFLDGLAGAWGPKVMSAAALAAHGGDDGGRAWLRGHDAGTGPYRLAALRSGGAALLRFEGYWGPQPHFAAVDIAAVPDPAAQVLRLRAGGLDAVGSLYPPMALVMLPDGMELSASPGMTMLTAFLNPLGRMLNPDLRGAALTAINPKLWLTKLLSRSAAMPGTLFPALMFETLDPLELPDDIDVAAHTVFRLGSPPLELAYPLDQAAALRPVLDILASRLHAIGLDATAVPATADAVAGYAANPATAPDVYLALATPAAAHPALLARGYFASNAPGNVFGLIVPAADRLIAQAETQAARVASDKTFIILSRKLTDMQGFIPIAEMRSVVVHRAGLSNIVTRPSFPPGAFDYALATETP